MRYAEGIRRLKQVLPWWTEWSCSNCGRQKLTKLDPQTFKFCPHCSSKGTVTVHD